MVEASDTSPTQIRSRAELSGMSGWERSIRLWSGIVLFVFVLMHFLNHALGIFGVATMEAVQEWRELIWRSLPGTALLYGAAVVHVTLALRRIVSRRTWRMPVREALQIVLGLAIPFLLYQHLLGTRYVSEFTGVNDAYGVTLQHLWPNNAVRQLALTATVWLHGIIGIIYSMRLQPWYGRVREPFLIVAVIIPLLAAAGFISAGREAVLLAHPDVKWTGTQVEAYLHAARWTYYGLLAAAASLALIILALALLPRLGRRVPIRYIGHGSVTPPRGLTLLETSRSQSIPHPSVCGGRARCSTCRVLVLEGAESLPPPSAAEAALLERISAPANVRLACQIKPTEPLTVQILLPIASNLRITPLGWMDEAYETGAETIATVLFIDIRAFTRLTKTQFPYDLVALLNRYMSEINQATDAHGGQASMFLTDGMMAVFGLNGEKGHGSRAAMAAAKDMMRAVESMNQEFQAALSMPLRVGIGIHTGPLIMARIGDDAHGYRATALGETVNIASRLELATKHELTECLVSAETLRAAGSMGEGTSRHEIHVPGRQDPIVAYGMDAVTKAKREEPA